MYWLPLLTFSNKSNKSHLGCDRLMKLVSENDDDEESIGLDKGTQLSEGYNYPCKGSHAILPSAKHHHDKDRDGRDPENRDKEEKEKILI